MLGGTLCAVTLQSHMRPSHTLAHHFQDAEIGPAVQHSPSAQRLLRAVLEIQGALESLSWLRSSCIGLGHAGHNLSLLDLPLQMKQLLWQWT